LGEKLKLKNNIKLFITCDSGAGAGKTTASKYISKKYGLDLLTSGLLYRMVAKKLLDANKNPKDISFLKKITKNISHRDLNSIKLYSPKITAYTSEIAKLKKIRILLKNYQSKFAKKRLVIIEGRDIGTLFPKADIKFFFKCSINIAAKRRFKEFRKINKTITLKEVKKAIRTRDLKDTKRENSPLRVPKGAVIIATSKLTKKQMFMKISKIVEKKLFIKYGRKFK
jgi:cytidylate kinase